MRSGYISNSAAYATEKWEPDFLEKCVERERHLLQFALEVPIRSLSWHNPDLSNLLDFDAEEIAGMKNAYSGRLRNRVQILL